MPAPEYARGDHVKELAFGLSLKKTPFQKAEMGKEYCEGQNGPDEKSLRHEQTKFEWGTECNERNCGNMAISTYLDHTV